MQRAYLFPERVPRNERIYGNFDHQTESQLACAFKRYPRGRPDPHDVPHYPWLPPRSQHFRVCFKLGWQTPPDSQIN